MSSNVVAINLQGCPKSHTKRASTRFVFTEARLLALRPDADGRTIIHCDERSPLAVR